MTAPVVLMQVTMALDFAREFEYARLVLKPFLNVTVSQLKRAAVIKGRIEELERELGSILGQDFRSSSTREPGSRKRRKMSAAARAKIAAAARARWAKYRAAKSR